ARFEMMDLVEDDDQASFERLLGVAHEDVHEPLDFVGGRARLAPQILDLLAELGRVLLDPGDEIAQQRPRIAVRGIERVPDRVRAEIADEPAHQARLAVSGPRENDRRAALESRSEAIVKARAGEVERP